MSEADRLQALREQIDSLDRHIQTLIAERARCAQQVGAIKQAGMKPLALAAILFLFLMIAAYALNRALI